MKALCPSGSHLHCPKGPPWGAVPPPWPPVHTDTPHGGDSPGPTQGNNNKLLSSQSPPPPGEAEAHPAGRLSPEGEAASQNGGYLPLTCTIEPGPGSTGSGPSCLHGPIETLFSLMAGFFEPLTPFWTLGWAQGPPAHSHGRAGALLGSAGGHLPTDGTAGPRGAIHLPHPPSRLGTLLPLR